MLLLLTVAIRAGVESGRWENGKHHEYLSWPLGASVLERAPRTSIVNSGVWEHRASGQGSAAASLFFHIFG